MTERRDQEIEELARRHEQLGEELCALVVGRLAERCGRIVAGAAALVYECEYEVSTRTHFRYPVAVVDGAGTVIELDDASADAAPLVGDLETLFSLAPGAYLTETQVIF